MKRYITIEVMPYERSTGFYPYCGDKCDYLDEDNMECSLFNISLKESDTRNEFRRCGDCLESGCQSAPRMDKDGKDES